MELGQRWIGRLCSRVLRLPRPRNPFATDEIRAVSRIIVIGKFPNPTFDYYFASRLAMPGTPSVEIVDIRDISHPIEANGAMVIIIRYTSIALSRWIRRNKRQLAAVVLFVDDDIAEAIISSETPSGYRHRLLRQSIFPLKLLIGSVDEIWVSTETLKRRLAYATPRLLPPAPQASAISPAVPPSHHSGKPETVTIAYHATAIHMEEHDFLIPVIAAVLKERPLVKFEVVSDGQTADRWKDLDNHRVIIKPPLAWHSYLKDQTKQIAIMLVPVAPSKLNECRADTKRIDVVRVNAAALFSDCSAFRPAEEGERLLPYDRAIWHRHILSLIDNEDERASLAAATRRRVLAMHQRAADGLPLISRR